MNIYEFADMVDKSIIIKYCPNQNGRFYACFEHGETKENKDDCCLLGNYGNGSTPTTAVDEYSRIISGRYIVFNAMSQENRQEFKIPILRSDI